MRGMCSRSLGRAFTLVELMIVVTIVAILATASVPIYRSYVTRAKMSEGVAGCGAIRTLMRVYAGTHDGVYPTMNASGDALGSLGMHYEDLDGKYFKAEDYEVVSTRDGYTITASLSPGMTYSIDQDGNEVGEMRILDD